MTREHQSLRSALDDVLGKLQTATPVGRDLVASTWQHVVGKDIADKTVVRGYRNGMLSIECASSVLAYQLNVVERQTIIEKLRDQLLHFQDFRVRPGCAQPKRGDSE